ncbi:hypothetical protein BGX38DRAFT_1204307 [Terfezia claveryi]|nr:hypothetical protein BGX38DRAFT_1204307 [Terfezia claveryi]
MPSWSDSERNKMFLAMIELMAPHGSNNKLPSWTLVAERMQSGFTGEAVRQQFQKCRKEGLPRNIPPRSSSGKTSSSRSRASRGGKRFSSGDFDDDDDESLLSANKRVKLEANKLLATGIHSAGQLANANDGARPVKMENMDGEQAIGAHVGMGIGMEMGVGSN